MSTQNTSRWFLCLASAMALANLGASQDAVAALSITNGNFEADAAAQTSNVTDWFDTVTANTANWWESTWSGTNVSPNGTSVLGLSFLTETTNWAYQSLGVNDEALTSLDLTFDLGSFTDADGFAPGGRDMGLSLSVYSVDGTYAGGADNTDIDGAIGATLIDSITVTTGGAIFAGDVVADLTALLDITGTTGSELFLRLENVAGSTYVAGSDAGGPWLAVDNLRLPLDFVGFIWDDEAADGSYNNGTNWEGDSVPTLNSDVLFGTAISANRTVTLDTGADVQLNSVTFDAGASGDYYLTANTTERLVLSGTSGTNGEAVINVNSGRDWLQLEVDTSASQGIEKTGTGEIILDAANTYNGDTTVSGGRLSVLNNNAIPSGSNISIAAGADVVLSGGAVFFVDNGMASTGFIGGTIDGVISGDGTIILGGAADATFTAANTITGGIVAIEQSALTISGSGTLGTATTTIGGQSTLTLNAVSINSGTVNIDDESQLVLNSATLGTSPGGNLITLDENADGETAKIANSGTSTINHNIFASGDDEGSHYEISAAAGGSLTLSGTLSSLDDPAPNDRFFVFSGDGNINVTGQISDAVVDTADGSITAASTNTNVHVVKRDAGTLTIATGTTNANDFWLGDTTIEGGTLTVQSPDGTSGELRGTSINVQSGATFDISSFTNYSLQVVEDPDTIAFNGDEVGQTVTGSGTINTGSGTLLAFEDAVFAPGDSGAGSLNVTGNLNINRSQANPNGAMNYDLSASAAGTNDLINVSGTLTLATAGTGAFAFNFMPIHNALESGTPYTVMQGGNLTGGATAGNFTGQIVKASGDPMTTRLTPSFTVNSGASGNVQVTFSGSTMSLTWSGNVDSDWNVNSTANWNSGTQTYYDLDSVTFNASGGGGSIVVAESVLPNAMTVSDTAYSFSGSDISAGSVTVNSSGTASFSNTVSGNVTVASTGTLAGTGTFSNNVTVQSGGTLQIGGDGLALVSAISIANGDFEAGAAAEGQSASDVPAPWFDYDNGTNFWENAWNMNWNGASFNDTSMLLLSAFAADETLDGAGLNGYAYQSIGTDVTATSLDLSFVWGSPDDASGIRDLGLTITILESDGTFVPDEQADILGQTGITILDTVNLLELDVPISGTFNEDLNFDISGQTGGELFIRINNYETADGQLVDEAWIGVDNLNLLASGSGSAFAGETMTVSSDLVLEAGSTAAFDIAESGVNDLLNVTGELTAAGTLQVTLEPGAPALADGDAFDILDFGTATGAFDTLNLPALGSGLSWDTSNLLTTGVLEVFASLLAGDLDADGFVGITDLNVILSQWNDTVTPGDLLSGDPSGDGFVGIEDLNVVLANWNNGTPPTSNAAIPEPASFVLLGLGSLAMIRRR